MSKHQTCIIYRIKELGLFFSDQIRNGSFDVGIIRFFCLKKEDAFI